MDSQGELTALLTRNGHRQERGKNAESTDQRPAFPYYQFSVLAFGLFAEPIALGASFTYSFALVGDLKGGPHKAFYTGLLISAYTLAETCMASTWASFSDRHGRRPVFLLSLAGLALSSLTVGFSRSYWLVLAARIAGGLLNGNSRVVPRMVAEMAPGSALAASIPSLMWYLGHLSGCLLGGFAARPAEQYPGYFSSHRIFGRFPYLLPNLIVSYLLVAATVQSVFLLEETNTDVLREAGSSREKAMPSKASKEATSSETSEDCRASPSSPRPTRPLYTEESRLIGQKPHFYPRSWSPSPVRHHDSIMKTTRLAQIRELEELKIEDGLFSETPSKSLASRTVLWTVALALLSFHEMAFDFFLPTYALDEQTAVASRLDLDGGLGQNLSQIGFYLALGDITALFAQGFIFPVSAARLGPLTSVISATILCPLVYWTMPFVSLFPSASIGVCLVVVLQRILTTTSRSGALILLRSTVGETYSLSRVHDFTSFACSIARAMSPIAVGMVCSTLGSAAAWWSCALVATLAITELGFICTIKEEKRSTPDRGTAAA